MKILLLHLPLPGMIKVPTGLLGISSFLAARGHEVRVHDMRLPRSGGNTADLEPLVRWSGLVGVSLMTIQIPAFLDFFQHFGTLFAGRLVVGGVHAALYPEQLTRYATHVCDGEGEPFLVRLAEGPGGVDESSRPWLDVMRRYDLFDTPAYVERGDTVYTPLAGPRHLSVETARGCNNRCAFCVNTVLPWGRPWRPRDADVVDAEIGVLAEQYGVERLTFDDEHFFSNADRAMTIITRARRRIGAGFRCGGSITVREVLGKCDLLREAAAAGLHSVSLGIESGCNETLKRIAKPHRADEAREAAAVLASLGLYAVYSYITAIPGSPPDADQKTIRLAADIQSVHPNSRSSPPNGTQPYRPYPRTRLAGDMPLPVSLLEFLERPDLLLA